jgi:hypothetical protein
MSQFGSVAVLEAFSRLSELVGILGQTRNLGSESGELVTDPFSRLVSIQVCASKC